MNPVLWSDYKRPTKDKPYGYVVGNDGAYLITSSTHSQLVVPWVRKTRPSGSEYYDHVEPDYEFTSILDAMKACERHKFLCPSMFTTAPVDMKPKNSNPLLGQIVSALNAGKPKDSSERSPKCGSLSLEALLSRKPLGEQNGVGVTDVEPFGMIDRLAGWLLYSKGTIESGLRGIGLNPEYFDFGEVAKCLKHYGIERCRLCQRWDDHKEIYNGYCTSCDQL